MPAEPIAMHKIKELLRLKYDCALLHGLPTGARPPAYEARWRSPVDKPAPRPELTVIVTDAVRI